MKNFYVSAVLLFSLFAVALSLSCMPCDRTVCGPKPICKGGYTKNVCGCCDVCAKLEGETCGGFWNHYGHCDTDLTCVTRINGKLINKDLDRLIHPGHCEDDKCAQLKCGLHQKCSVVNENPKCECPRHCKNEDKPVCGLNDGKQHLNQCHLRRYECKTGQRIPVVKGPCKYCAYKGQIYKFGEKMKKNEKCQVCSCAHGKWNCAADPTCEMPAQTHLTPCVVPGPRGRDTCPDGSMCAYVTINSVQHGRCVPIPTTTPTPVTEKPRSECPLRKCKPCKHGFEVDDKGCRTCQCKKVNVCNLPNYTGPCRANFPRFYFNKKTGKCSHFTYGGCKSNGNNFKTKKQCELKCIV